MPRKAFTFRIDPDVQAALATLSKILHRPMNRLVNEAVKAYLKRRSQEVERDLEASLASLRAHRKRDPDFEQAIAAFVEAEASMEDPVEGRPETDSGPVRTEIQRLLNA
ncbi:MAG: hypothetical protein ACREK9_06335 [Candidatus Rokuibacteriota bacterium]